MAPRSKVVAWALWDCGSTGLNAIVVTFVFSVYLTGTVGQGIAGDTSPASWLGRALTIAGLTVALLAPLTGVLVQAPHRRRVALMTLTGLAAAFTAAMSLIRDDPRYLPAGLALLAVTAACSDLASVPYNAMLRQLSTPQTSGRISGFGWAAGYAGSVVLLLLVYVGFIAGDGPHRGLLGLPTADGQNVRAAMVLAAVWILVFGLPLMLSAWPRAGAPPRTAAPEPAARPRLQPRGALPPRHADLPRAGLPP
jgi:UMF1 family MFS transporter